MGVIAQRVDELDGKLKYIYSTACEIDTVYLQRDLEKTVYKALESLKPLRHRYIVLPETKFQDRIYSYTCQIAVGEWLRIKYSWQRFGSPIHNREEAFKILREHGDVIALNVRKTIREVVTQLVELTKKLTPYDHVEVSRQVNVTTRIRALRGEWSVFRVEKIAVGTSNPFWVRYLYEEGSGYPPRADSSSFLIDRWDDVALIEDLIDDLVELYTEAKKKVMEVKAWNDKLLAEMKSLVAPYLIAKELNNH